MPWVIRDVVDDINKAVTRRWRQLDPLLPEPTMFVRPDERSGGIGAALVRHVDGELDARGIDLTLLHYAKVNPLSAPFWHRMGYRPLWSTWEARPAAALR